MQSPPLVQTKETAWQALRRERREKKYARYQQAIASQASPHHIYQRPHFINTVQLHANAPMPPTPSQRLTEADKFVQYPSKYSFHLSLTEQDYKLCHYKDVMTQRTWMDYAFDYSIIPMDPSDSISITRHMLLRRRYHVHLNHFQLYE